MIVSESMPSIAELIRTQNPPSEMLSGFEFLELNPKKLKRRPIDQLSKWSSNRMGALG